MKHFIKRIVLLLVGLVLFSLGIVITIKANIGYAPWEVFHVGLAITTGLSIGTISIIIGAVIVIILLLLREKLGFGTIFNIILIGIIIDVIFPYIPLGETLITGIIMMLAGIFIISVGTCLYLKAAFGAGPRDGLMVVLSRRTRRSVGFCRFAMEFVVTIIGFFFGGMVGAGTVLFVIAIGFFIQMTFKLFRFDATAVRHETMLDTYTLLKNARRL